MPKSIKNKRKLQIFMCRICRSVYKDGSHELRRKSVSWKQHRKLSKRKKAKVDKRNPLEALGTTGIFSRGGREILLGTNTNICWTIFGIFLPRAAIGLRAALIGNTAFTPQTGCAFVLPRKDRTQMGVAETICISSAYKQAVRTLLSATCERSIFLRF